MVLETTMPVILAQQSDVSQHHPYTTIEMASRKMPVPDFQSLMLPLLKITGDGNEHSTSEVIEILAQQFGLSENDRDEMLSSGKQRKLDNRVNWTKTYLQKALLLSSTGRSSMIMLLQALSSVLYNKELTGLLW